MKKQTPPNIPLAVVIVAAVVAIALRAMDRRPEPQRELGAEPAPVTATANVSPPPPAVTVGVRDIAGNAMAARYLGFSRSTIAFSQVGLSRTRPLRKGQKRQRRGVVTR